MQTEWTYEGLTQAVKEFIKPDASCELSAGLTEFHRIISAGVFHFWDALTGDVQKQRDKAQIQDMLRGLP